MPKKPVEGEIVKQTKPIEGEVLVKDALNPRQELFCELYTSADEFFANGTQSYIEAYDIDLTEKNAYQTAAAAASRLLKNVKVLNHINKLLEFRGLNNGFVDKQLEFLVTQNAELGTKLAAIKEYNKLKERVFDRTEVVHKFKDMSDEELERAIKAREDRLS